VALFLAELYATTGDPNVRRTALGAISQALSAAHRLPPAEQYSLYTGGLGIVLAALRAARLLNEETLYELALHLLNSIVTHPAPGAQTPVHDYLSGRAGSVLALLAIKDTSPDSRPLDLAVRMGDDLLHSAHKTRRGYSWPSARNQKHHDLTGLSHGAAGIGMALLELAHVTGDPRFSPAAQMAFSYERFWFDPSEANWPDFRLQHTRRSASSGGTLAYRTFWCHGAPGIALSRLRAHSLTGNSLYRQEAITALETTHKAVSRALHTTIHDFSLCHGLAGNCDVLLAAPSSMPNTASYLATVHQAASLGISLFSSSHQPWPCGVGGGHTPSLMLGTAGIGLFYLRLHTPSIPSPLLLTLTY
jgi:lantibiotic modifying enzyme